MISMPWWFWTILWILLVLVALASLTWLILRMISKGIQAVEEFMKFSDIALNAVDQTEPHQAHKLREKPDPAIFTPVSETFAEYHARKNKRIQQRISRRIHKREKLGQPQNLSDLTNTSRKGATHVR